MDVELVIVTGRSGSGKSVAVNALEDIGFFCVDNVPPQLIHTLALLALRSRDMQKRVAIVTDIRVGGNAFHALFDALEQLEAGEFSYKLLFLEAEDATLCRRFKETRRRHPLLSQYGDSLPEAIEAEQKILLPAKQIADYVIDTTQMSATQCKSRVVDLFANNPRDSMHIRCISFGYKYGTPHDADLVLDVRCLPNPFYVPELKTHTGLEQPVWDFVMRAGQAQVLKQKLLDLLDFLTPLYREEGKSQLVIAIGCTGGRHRSVVFTRIISEHLSAKQLMVSTQHRDIQK